MSSARPLTGGSAMLTDELQPERLRRLEPDQLRVLADELRGEVVRAVSANGGHLGPNLGVVELTLALHRVFDSPRDVLLWDTGHQSYIHKMVTGRISQFENLRMRGGVAGYPNRSESPHDHVESSHAGNALAYAAGFAIARAGGATNHVVAVVGDGALTAGVALEALNDILDRDLDMLVVLNDNGRSYAPTTGALAALLRQIRSGGGQASTIRRTGIAFTGPVDGHDIVAVERALRRARSGQGLRIVHVVTQKGRGYEPALRDQVDHLHGLGPFDPATGRPRPAGGGRVAAGGLLGRVLVEEGRLDERLHVITAAMGSASGLDDFQREFPDRFHDVGIAEQYAVVLACGLAMGGKRPVVAIHSTFLARAFDQILYEVGLHDLPVTFVIDRAGITGTDGPSHNGVHDLSIAQHVPGAAVYAPANAAEFGDIIRAATQSGGPAFVRYPRALGESPLPPLPPRPDPERRLLMVSYGGMAEVAWQAVNRLRDRGVPAELRIESRLLPCAPELLDAVGNSDLVAVLEDHGVVAGLGDTLLRALASRPEPGLPAVRVFGTPARFLPHGDVDSLRREVGIDPASLTEELTAMWRQL